ncbi:hypothetical protein AVEN_267979-1 [Araneus ventricosus]|uniref:Uncharacterized protein n=1 Tax=Araneus ventricosus TaxID=182803 RepID=A0A4Y2IWI1_ARAVE|nr:hypothetical protein AVEN_267979-1 [Araneus ventricosus]
MCRSGPERVFIFQNDSAEDSETQKNGHVSFKLPKKTLNRSQPLLPPPKLKNKFSLSMEEKEFDFMKEASHSLVKRACKIYPFQKRFLAINNQRE